MNEMRRLINIMENTTITEVPMSDFTDSLPGRSGRAGASGKGGAIGGTLGGIVGALVNHFTLHLGFFGNQDAVSGISHDAPIVTGTLEIFGDHIKAILGTPHFYNTFAWPAWLAINVGLGFYLGKKGGNAMDAWRNRRRSGKRQEHALKTLGIEPHSDMLGGGGQHHQQLKALAEKHAEELKMCATLIKQIGVKIASELGESTDIIEKEYLKIRNQSSKNQQAETNPLEDLGFRTGRDIDSFIERADANFDQIASKAGMTPAQLGALWYLQGGQYESVEQSMLMNIGNELERLGKMSAEFADKLYKANKDN